MACYLLLTTPNIANWVGRLTFLLTGEIRWFDETQYRFMQHISPITDTQMRLMLDELGFRLVTAPISFTFRAIFGRRVWGDCTIYLAARSEA